MRPAPFVVPVLQFYSPFHLRASCGEVQVHLLDSGNSFGSLISYFFLSHFDHSASPEGESATFIRSRLSIL